MSKRWDERRDKEVIKDLVKDYDWTYETKYRGTGTGFEVDDKQIDMEMLMRRDPILFYNSLDLYEGTCGLLTL